MSYLHRMRIFSTAPGSWHGDIEGRVVPRIADER
jgi:hypothetical protein